MLHGEEGKSESTNKHERISINFHVSLLSIITYASVSSFFYLFPFFSIFANLLISPIHSLSLSGSLLAAREPGAKRSMPSTPVFATRMPLNYRLALFYLFKCWMNRCHFKYCFVQVVCAITTLPFSSFEFQR